MINLSKFYLKINIKAVNTQVCIFINQVLSEAFFGASDIVALFYFLGLHNM